MKILELPRGVSVNIIARGDNKKIILPTRIVKDFNDCMLLELVKIDDKIVDFTSHKMGLRYELTAFIKGKPLIWKNVYIDKVTIYGESFHRIKCVNDAAICDRRQSNRVPVFIDGYIQVGEHATKTSEVKLVDFSKTGIGMQLSKKVKIKVGDVVRLTFFDNEVRGVGAPPEKVKYTFTCTIRRIQEETDDTNIVGAQIVNKDLRKADAFVKKKKKQ